MPEFNPQEEKDQRRIRTSDIKPLSDAMSPVLVDPHTRLIDALNLMRSRSIHHLVVMEETQVVGIVSDRNIFQSGMTANSIVLNPIMTVKDVMVRIPEALPADADLSTAIDMMRRYAATALPLVKDQRLVGIITESDLLRVMEAWAQRTLGTTSTQDVPVAPGSGLQEDEHKLRTESEIIMANPLMQNLMNLLAQAGI